VLRIIVERSVIPWIASAIGLGLAYAALPGVVNAEALRRGVARGMRPALLVHVGAVIGAAAWAGLALSGTAVLVRNDALAATLGLIGAAFLLRLARTALVGAVDGVVPVASAPRPGGDLTVGMIVSLANPAGFAFWAGLSGGVFAAAGDEVATGRAALFLTGVIVGSLLWGCAMALLVNWGRPFVGRRFFRVVNALCGVAFTYFGIRMGWTALRRLRHWLPLVTHGWS
jgi:threonine/homoserine/homoserine lactone efflux protein